MESHTGIIEKILDCRNTPRQAAVRLPKINTLRHFRIKTDAMAGALGCDFDHRIHHMLHANPVANDLFTVNTVHHTHHDRLIINDLFNGIQTSFKTAVFDSYNQKIGTFSLLRCFYAK